MNPQFVNDMYLVSDALNLLHKDTRIKDKELLRILRAIANFGVKLDRENPELLKYYITDIKKAISEVGKKYKAVDASELNMNRN